MAHSEGRKPRRSNSVVPMPLVSVVLPVFNGARFLEAAIRSVYSQDCCPIELIVVDDGSTDSSAEIVRAVAPESVLIRQENAGPAAARNTGLAVARADYYAFIDADDVWPPNKLDRQLCVLVDDEGPDVTLGLTRCLLPDETLAEPRFFMQLGCGLYRRRAFERIGRFDAAIQPSEDIDWFTRAREAGLKFSVTEDVTLHYRLHEDNLTRGTDAHDLGHVRIVKRSLDRRRARARTGPIELPPL